MSDDEAAIAKRRGRSRAAALVLFCFLLGAALAAAFAFKAGYLGATAAQGGSTLDGQLARANDALKQKRWDAPPGDNVKDLTNDALARWPGDARFLDLRARATDELVKDALGKKFAGDAEGALHLVRLARELDPSDSTAQHLEGELEATLGQVAPTVPTAAGSAPTVPTSARPTPVRPAGGAGGGGGAGARAALDVSTVRPRVGQQVELTAKLVAKAPPEDPHFEIAGPGGSSTRLAATANGSIYKGTFSFLEAGKYDVTFTAKVDGTPVRAGRTILAGSGGGGASPGPAPSGDGPQPPPTPPGKWL
jgi:serine/threonine-protein kinase